MVDDFKMGVIIENLNSLCYSTSRYLVLHLTSHRSALPLSPPPISTLIQFHKPTTFTPALHKHTSLRKHLFLFPHWSFLFFKSQLKHHFLQKDLLDQLRLQITIFIWTLTFLFFQILMSKTLSYILRSIILTMYFQHT